jgi:large subunit ribosomal protein L9
VEVILLEKMRNLGALGEKVAVPQGKAVYATDANVAKFEQRRAELEKLAAERLKAATERQQAINAIPPIVIVAKAGEEGKLFGSVGIRDLINAIHAAGIADIAKREICLPEGALRQTGDYEIMIELDSDVTASLKVKITSEG